MLCNSLDAPVVHRAVEEPMGMFRAKVWSPYLVGALLGVLSWFAFASADHGLGITTAFEHTAALAAEPALGASHEYYLEKTGEDAPKIGWEWMLVAGVFFGALLSAKLSGDRSRDRVPELWRARFGASATKRYGAAFAGGAILMFGARLAQGCTSGHGITGALQLAVSSWVFAGTFFVTGALFAALVFPRKEIDDVRSAA